MGEIECVFCQEIIDSLKHEIEIIRKKDNAVVYKIATEHGKAYITSFEVFPGVELLYNDIKMSNFLKADAIQQDVMEINHCRKGRFECDFYNGTCVYLERGDLSVNMTSDQTKNSYFPLEHYFGVSVVIDLNEANRYLSSVIIDISIDLFKLRDKLCRDNSCFIMRATDSIQHIFSELYTVR